MKYEIEKTDIVMRRWLLTAPVLPKQVRTELQSGIDVSRQCLHVALLPLCQVLRKRGWAYSNIERVVFGSTYNRLPMFHRMVGNTVTKYGWDTHSEERQLAAIKAADTTEDFLIANQHLMSRRG